MTGRLGRCAAFLLPSLVLLVLVVFHVLYLSLALPNELLPIMFHLRLYRHARLQGSSAALQLVLILHGFHLDLT